MPRSMQDLKFPDQGSNPCPQQWKRGALTTGLPGNPPASFWGAHSPKDPSTNGWCILVLVHILLCTNVSWKGLFF